MKKAIIALLWVLSLACYCQAQSIPPIVMTRSIQAARQKYYTASAPVTPGYWTDTNNYYFLVEAQQTNTTQLLDTSGNNRNFTVLGSAYLTGAYTNQFGRVDRFMWLSDADNSLIYTATDSVVTNMNYTVGAWCWVTTGTLEENVGPMIAYAAHSDASIVDDWEIQPGRLVGNYTGVGTQIGGVYKFVYNSRPVVRDAWQFMVVTAQGTNLTIYMDGNYFTNGECYAQMSAINRMSFGKSYFRTGLTGYGWRGAETFMFGCNYAMPPSAISDLCKYTNPTNNIRWRPDTFNTWVTNMDVNGGYGDVALNYDGSVILAGGVVGASGRPCVSTNGGANFYNTASTNNVAWVCMNWNGATQAYASRTAGGGNGYIYVSTDTGQTWVAKSGTGVKDWMGVRMSSNGLVIYGTAQNQLWMTFDTGTTWSNMSSASASYWPSMSADGNIDWACQYGAQGLLSKNHGVTWVTNDVVGNWYGSGMSMDGQYITKAANGGNIYRSTDTGATWSASDAGAGSWTYCNMDATGQYQINCKAGGKVYVSTNWGVNWTAKGDSVAGMNVTSVSGNKKVRAAVCNTGAAGRILINRD